MKILAIILGFMMIGTGITCISVPAATATLPGLFLGIVMVVEGIGNLIAWLNIKREGQSDGILFWAGIFSALLGFVLLGNDLLKLEISVTLITFLAIWMTVIGVLRIADAFRIRRLKTDAGDIAGNGNTVQERAARLQLKEIGRAWWAVLVLGILLVILGVLCFFDPIKALLAMGVMLGISIIMTGIDLIANAFIAD